MTLVGCVLAWGMTFLLLYARNIPHPPWKTQKSGRFLPAEAPKKDVDWGQKNGVKLGR
jgi:hypothetical protein